MKTKPEGKPEMTLDTPLLREEDVITPIGARVLIKRDDPETISDGGILIPENAQERSWEGTVVAIGEGRNEKGELVARDEIVVGDHVVFSRFAGTEIYNAFNVFHICPIEEILAVRL